MIDYKLLKKNGITPKSIRNVNNSFIVDTGDSKYLVKEKLSDLDRKFNYLYSRNFNYFPKHKTLGDYDLYEYIENSEISEEEKLNEMVDLISLLHTKTTRYKNIDIDDYKIIYEKLDKKIDYLMNYYSELNDIIDSEIYMSPSHYLLAFNISKIYSALSFCKRELDNWYEMVKNSPRQRVAFIHNNLDLNHLISSSNPYLISWGRSKVDFPFYDLISLYKKYYLDTDFSILLDNYQKRYPLNPEELKLFFIEISIPEKLEFLENEFDNTKKVKHLLETLDKGDKLIRPYYDNES